MLEQLDTQIGKVKNSADVLGNKLAELQELREALNGQKPDDLVPAKAGPIELQVAVSVLLQSKINEAITAQNKLNEALVKLYEDTDKMLQLPIPIGRPQPTESIEEAIRDAAIDRLAERSVEAK